MNDLGVSLHSHNGEETFLAAARKLRAKGALEFNRKYLTAGAFVGQSDSPVIGVARTTPVIKSTALLPALSARRNDFPGLLEDYARAGVERLRQHLRTHWDATHPTLVLHSNGYDSRILSSILAELRDEGFDLGRIHFRCHEPEGDSFKLIMQRQGWSPDQYSVFEAPAEDIFDVGNWDRPGTSPWLAVTTFANFWRDIVPESEEKNWNLMTGTGGGEMCEYPTLGKEKFVPWIFCPNLPVDRWWGYFGDGTDVVGDMEARFHKALFPYFGAGHIATASELREDFLGYEGGGTWMTACDRVRGAMLRTFKDNLLDLPRVPRTYRWSISEKRWAEMAERYDQSRFRRDVPEAPETKALFARMKANFFSNESGAERLWRFASLWEQIA